MYSICKCCDLGILSDRRPVGEKSEQKQVFFINDITTPTDAKKGQAFTGRSGKLLRLFLDKFNLTDYSYLTNIIKCEIDTYQKYYAKKCKNILITEIKVHKPKIIVTVGKNVYEELMDKEIYSMSSVINKPIIFANSILIPIYGTAYINKNGLEEEYFKSFDIIADIFEKLNKYYTNPNVYG